MNKNPRTVREALVAELLGDVDTLLTRLEALAPTVASAEKSVLDSVAALEGAGDRYRMVITAFSEQAKKDLADYLDRITHQAAAQTADEQRAAMQEAARHAFRSEASDKATALGISLGEAAKEFRRSMWTRVLEHGVTAVLASLLTLSLAHWVFKLL